MNWWFPFTFHLKMQHVILILFSVTFVSCLLSSSFAESSSELCSIQHDDDYYTAKGSRNKRAVIRERERIWPKGVIPYLILDGTFSQDQVDMIHYAMNVWMNKTCVKFKEWTFDDMDLIIFAPTTGQFCSAPVGFRSGSQYVTLGQSCFSKAGYIIHELGHVLGLWHEHDRPDRNKYVKIIWNNVIKGKEFHFLRRKRFEIQSFYSSYDYGSIMHYELKAFSKNSNATMEPKHNYTGVIGQRELPSDSDYEQLSILYGCKKFIPPCTLPDEGSGGSGKEWEPVFLHNNNNNDTINCTDLMFKPSSTIITSPNHITTTTTTALSKSITNSRQKESFQTSMVSHDILSFTTSYQLSLNGLSTYEEMTTISFTNLLLSNTPLSNSEPLFFLPVTTAPILMTSMPTSVTSTSSRPVTFTPTPVTSTSIRPVTSTSSRPVTSTSSRPVTSTPTPVTSTYIRPVTSTPIPVTSTPIPVTSTSSRPVTSTPIPVTSTYIRPVTSTSSRPVTSTPTPVTSTYIKPVTSTPIPVTSTPIPVTSTSSRPVTSTSSRPVTSTSSRPVTSIPIPSSRPVTSTSIIPIASKSVSIIHKPSLAPLKHINPTSSSTNITSINIVPSSVQVTTASLDSTALFVTPSNVIDKTITSGEAVGLRLANFNSTGQIHWISCYPLRCKVTSCHDDTVGYPQCPPALFSLVKINEPLSDILVGDLIVLRPHHNNKLIITCGRGVCRGYDYCNLLTSKKCRRHYLKVIVRNKSEGQKVEHDDKIELKFHNLDNDYIKCDESDYKCRRSSVCQYNNNNNNNNEQCLNRPTSFYVFKLLM